MPSRRLLVNTTILLAFMSLCALLMGYSEAVPYVLHQQARKLSAQGAARIELVRTSFDAEGKAASVVPALVSYKRPDSIKIEPLEGATLTPLSVEKRALDILLSAGNAQTMAEALNALGISLTEKSLQRQDGKVCNVVGVGAPDAKMPQFSVDKFQDQPARLVFLMKEAQAEVAYEVRYLDWSAPATHDLFPRRIEFYQDGRLLLVYEALRAKKGA